MSLLAVNAFIYAQSAGFGFIGYDDPGYVSNNPQVQSSLSWRGLAWAFTTFERSNWHPLTWLSLMLDRQLFGPAAGGFHLVNVFLHQVNAVLVFLFLRAVASGAGRPAALGALLWTAHPLRVESVAWVTERKDVLSTLFLLGTLLAYLRYARGGETRFYVVALGSAGLGLLAKPMLVTVPALLALLDWWPLRRREAGASWRQLGWEKAPFTVLAAVASVITCRAQSDASVALSAFPLPWRLVHAVCAYGEYLAKTFWPAGLALPYPFTDGVCWGWFAGSLTAVIFGTWAVLRAARTRPYLALGWLWFLGTLVPVIGLVQVGSQSLADRYTYVPHLGLAMIVGMAAVDPGLRGWARPGWVAGLALAGAAVLAILSHEQTALWRDSVSLFTHTQEVCGRTHLTERLLGSGYLEAGDLPRALNRYASASKLQPENSTDAAIVGTLHLRLGHFAEAVAPLAQVVAREPGNAEVLHQLGCALAGAGHREEAAAVFRHGLERWPADEFARQALANLSPDDL